MTTFYNNYLTIGFGISFVIGAIIFISLYRSLHLKKFDDWLFTFMVAVTVSVICCLTTLVIPYLFGQTHNQLISEKQIYPNKDNVTLTLKTDTDGPITLTKDTAKDSLLSADVTELQLSRNKQKISYDIDDVSLKGQGSLESVTYQAYSAYNTFLGHRLLKDNYKKHSLKLTFVETTDKTLANFLN